MTAQKNYILSKETAEKKLLRMAYEILEENMDEKEIILAGIRESGTVVGKVIRQMLEEISDIKPELITVSLDKKNPKEVKLSKKLSFDNKVIIVTDDVANSGKTLLYAMKPFLEYHPKKIQTLVLVERSHKTFPVHPDYAGLSVATTLKEHIYVEVKDDNILGAYLE